MPVYNWQGRTRDGAKKKGALEAANEAAVTAQLRSQGILPTKVKVKPKDVEEIFTFLQKRVKTKDLVIFTRQFAVMIDAGLPLVQCLQILADQSENPSLKRVVDEVRNEVESGSTFAEALAKHPKVFDDLYVNLVSAGEQAGALETLLDKIATYKEKTEAIKKKVKKALFYPAAVVVVAFIVTAILLIYVIPEFESLFDGFGADLPAFTRFVIDISNFVRSEGWIIAIGMIGGASAFIYFRKRSRSMQHFLDRVVLRIPIIGPILNKSAIARYARTLSTTFAAGVPLVEALDSVAGATGNIVYETAVLQMRDEVATGTRLQRAMENTDLFPNMVNQMIAVGEESGSLDDMSGKVADFYEEEVDNAVDSMSSLLEPLIMAVLGVLVGGLVIAMYLPIFKMGAVV